MPNNDLNSLMPYMLKEVMHEAVEVGHDLDEIKRRLDSANLKMLEMFAPPGAGQNSQQATAAKEIEGIYANFRKTMPELYAEMQESLANKGDDTDS